MRRQSDTAGGVEVHRGWELLLNILLGVYVSLYFEVFPHR